MALLLQEVKSSHMLIRRILAQIVDFVLGILTIFLIFVGGIPLIGRVINNDFVAVLTAICLMCVMYFALQYPFMQNQQTIGKAFFSCRSFQQINIAKMFQWQSFSTRDFMQTSQLFLHLPAATVWQRRRA